VGAKILPCSYQNKLLAQKRKGVPNDVPYSPLDKSGRTPLLNGNYGFTPVKIRRNSVVGNPEASTIKISLKVPSLKA